MRLELTRLRPDLGLLTWATCLIACLMVLLLSGCSPSADPGASTPTTATATNTPATNSPAPQAKVEFLPLTGKWGRTDGDYLLEIKGVDAEGKLTAGYYNPNPIKISQARAFQEGENVKVVIELRDTGYPGCVYNMNYDRGSDQLVGTYFQAAMGETFQIAFMGIKP